MDCITLKKKKFLLFTDIKFDICVLTDNKGNYVGIEVTKIKDGKEYSGMCKMLKSTEITHIEAVIDDSDVKIVIYSRSLTDDNVGYIDLYRANIETMVIKPTRNEYQIP